MRNQRSKYVLLSGLTLAFIAGGSACASSRLPPKDLTDARDEVWRARQTASQLDPTDVHEADLALATAEKAWQDDPDSPSTRDLAQIAQRRAQMAEAEANTDEALREAAAAKQQVQLLAQSQLASARGQLGQTQDELNHTRQQLQTQVQQTDEQRKQLLDTQAQLESARATIAKVASVKDDDRGMVITLQSELLFQTGKSDLKAGAMAKLDQIAEALKGKEKSIRVVGYTDDVGARDNNMALSDSRARAVRDYLVSKGMPQDLIQTEGKGPDDPVAENTSVEGRAQNRRVELIVEPKKG